MLDTLGEVSELDSTIVTRKYNMMTKIGASQAYEGPIGHDTALSHHDGRLKFGNFPERVQQYLR